MKIIFLDIDGVLNSDESMRRKKRSGYGFDIHNTTQSYDCPSQPMIENLNHIVENTGAYIVISSSWRHYHKIDEIKQLFEKLEIKGKIVDYTPVVKLSTYRGLEIQNWIDNYNEAKAKGNFLLKPIKSFVILDDNNDMLNLKDRLVLTDYKIGLTKTNAEEAIKILNN